MTMFSKAEWILSKSKKKSPNYGLKYLISWNWYLNIPLHIHSSLQKRRHISTCHSHSVEHSSLLAVHSPLKNEYTLTKQSGSNTSSLNFLSCQQNRKSHAENYVSLSPQKSLHKNLTLHHFKFIWEKER